MMLEIWEDLSVHKHNGNEIKMGVLTDVPLFLVTGTTCATVLTRAIFVEGCKSVAAGMNAMDLRRGITMAVDAVVTNLKSRARMISTSEEIAQVCFSEYCICS